MPFLFAADLCVEDCRLRRRPSLLLDVDVYVCLLLRSLRWTTVPYSVASL